MCVAPTCNDSGSRRASGCTSSPAMHTSLVVQTLEFITNTNMDIDIAMFLVNGHANIEYMITSNIDVAMFLSNLYMDIQI